MNIIVFVIGLLIGSFLNSFVWRYRKNILETIFSERSMCPLCGHALSPNDLVPLFSFMVLGGKCRYCRGPISWQYPFVELFFALLTLLLYWQFGLGISFGFYLLIGFILAALLVIDILDGVLPNGLVVSLLLVAVSFMILTSVNGWIWLDAVVGGLFGFGFFMALWLITLGKGVGIGDIKLALVLGILSGTPYIYYVIILSFFLGTLYVIPLLVIGKKHWKSKVPFGPFLILAYYLMLFLGDKIELWVNLYL